MKDVFSAVKVADSVYWVGAIDWTTRDFHGYKTGMGTTYNAYLVLAEKVTLIDTVKAPYRDEMLSRIASIVDPRKIDYIISNHSEMDHSGCLPEVIARVGPERIYASAMGVDALEKHFHAGMEIIPVADGAAVDLGNMQIRCYETRMLHWPDSMFSYLEEERLLFSQDAFGMHLASSERFDDQLEESVLEYEGAKYYANILTPFSRFVVKLLDRVGSLGIEARIIAPDHGPIWRARPGWILELYGKWARRETTDKAVVVYDTMWGSTDMMARAVGDGLTAGGARVKLMKLRASHRSDIATELLDAKALLVGSPTINNNIFPTLADVLVYLKGLKFKGLVGAAFGSYGWSGESVKQLEQMLKDMNVDLVADPVRVQYVPDGAALAGCRALGEEVARHMKEGGGA